MQLVWIFFFVILTSSVHFLSPGNQSPGINSSFHLHSLTSFNSEMTVLVDRGEEWGLFVLTLARLLRLSLSIIMDRLMKCGLNEWTVRWTEIQLNICAQRFVKSGMIFKKKEVPSPAHGEELPQPPVQTRGCWKAARQILDGKESRRNQTLLSGALWQGRCQWTQNKAPETPCEHKRCFYWEDGQWDRFPREVVWSLQPWRYLKLSLGHSLDAALGTGLG